MAKKAGDRAVVIGGSIAGLAAARVLADHFDRVVVRIAAARAAQSEAQAAG